MKNENGNTRKPKPHTEVIVPELPQCDFCASLGIKRAAYADARMQFGSWANVCKSHFEQNGCTLGLGAGQKLVLRKAAP